MRQLTVPELDPAPGLTGPVGTILEVPLEEGLPVPELWQINSHDYRHGWQSWL